MYIYIYTHVYAHSSVYTHTCTQIEELDGLESIYARMIPRLNRQNMYDCSACTRAYIHTYTYTCIHTHMHTTHTHIHTNVYTHMHTHTQIEELDGENMYDCTGCGKDAARRKQSQGGKKGIDKKDEKDAKIPPVKSPAAKQVSWREIDVYMGMIDICPHMCVRLCIHACTLKLFMAFTCIHTCIHACMHGLRHTYIHAQGLLWNLPDMHTHTHTYIYIYNI
jgi:hypothetical protein